MVELLSQLLDSLPGMRAFLGSILVFLLPGFAWTLVFFNGRPLTILERLVLSIGLSVASVTLSILAMNVVLGMRITTINSALTVLAVTIIPALLYCLNRFVLKGAAIVKAGRRTEE